MTFEIEGWFVRGSRPEQLELDPLGVFFGRSSFISFLHIKHSVEQSFVESFKVTRHAQLYVEVYIIDFICINIM